MTPARAALVEKVARAISNPDGSEDNWKFWTGEAEIAIDIIRAEVLEEAAKVAGAASVEPGYTTNEHMLAHRIARRIRALKGESK